MKGADEMDKEAFLDELERIKFYERRESTRTTSRLVGEIIEIAKRLDNPELTEEQAIDYLRQGTPFSADEVREQLKQLEIRGGVIDLKYLPKTPTIPEDVHHYIEWLKDLELKGREVPVALTLKEAKEFPFEYQEVINWINNNYKDFCTAYAFTYVIERQKYYVYLGDGQYLVSEDKLKNPHAKIRHEEDSGFLNYVHGFTKQEIKDYDERYWAFAKPIKEVEE